VTVEQARSYKTLERLAFEHGQLEPEKAAAMPLEVHFTKEYRYALRGRETIDGRDCWVVEFEPALPVAGRNPYPGTV